MNSSQSYLERSNAVLFHARFMSKKPPAVYELPKVRPLNQKWVFFESEAPTNTWNYVSTNETYWKLFNITVTYTSDSDIPLEYHRMKCLPKENWSTKTLNHAAKKTKFSAWFVSHCKTSSRRELYVKELQKYISVDIYGSCSNSSKCLRNSQDVSEQQNCMMDVINSDYKFYLSFENSFCSEYVTEKFNRIVRFGNVIPIVLGSADYGKIIPRGTYIDVRDFGSPKELADYLHTVANDDGLYNEYINRKKGYVCRIKRSFNCNLCEYLHKHRYEKEVVYDAARFWSTRFRCTSPKDFYRDVAPDLAKKIEFSRSPEVFL
ncbi:hypothetical protein CAPTEDRAFT_124056 [Capitella teleta]|uniref:Fucosyltransferase n=1 Tax=Capitella teleta TaxID=283909 RepID=R7TA11_CAPTE|nr:hypothetical protein CAPTEDRAFT_124056 [Capitella teleta]|eukprot:ELT90307.1 hypothetical protein CAPTEDRAFT_124056 [Capitella teleta]